MYDLTIIGAGPAGSSAATAAARSGISTLLLERGRFPRNKVCGEFVSAESLGLLSWLLDASRKDLLNEALRISQVRIFADGIVLTGPLDPPAASIARFDLDVALWEAAQHSGVETREQATAKAVEGEGPFDVVTSQGVFKSRAVINASGRWSNLSARARTITKPRQKWLGVKAHFADPRPSQTVDLYFFNGGYCGTSPVTLHGETNASRINVCAMVRSDVASTLSDVFEQNSSLRERSRSWQQLTEPVSTSPLIFGEPRPTDGNILLAGDAAAFVDPFVGDGISLALRSGNLSALSLMPFLASRSSLTEATRSYREAYEREFFRIFRTSAKLRHMFFLLPRVVRFMLLATFKRSPALVRYLIQRTR